MGALRRHNEQVGKGKRRIILPGYHPAVIESRTLFPNRNLRAADADRVLKSGFNSRKIGARVTKGKWKGFPIFTLTLEERHTCPKSCKEWSACYGNTMQWAQRFQPGPDLEDRLEIELDALQHIHHRGFVVRLHVLGDFYSLEYAEKWVKWIRRFPALHVFGYTAHRLDSDIGKVLRLHVWRRWAMRFSGHQGSAGAVVAPEQGSAPPGAVVCPAQTGRTECCATCGFCWHSQRLVAFLRH